MQNLQDVLQMFDTLLEQNKQQEAENLLLDSLLHAKKEQDDVVCLQILNELLGYYRTISAKDKLIKTIEETFYYAHKLHLEGSIPYATSLLNIANCYRSIGDLEKSLEGYQEVERIYEKLVTKQDMLFAGFYNNYSLLQQELKDYEKAREYLLKALAIAEGNQAGFEVASTYANLANTCVMAKDYIRAKEYAKEAITYFEMKKSLNPHYCAALSALGMCFYQEKDYKKAEEVFETAAKIVESSVGKNAQYQRIVDNISMCRQAMEENRNDKNRENDILMKNLSGIELSKLFFEQVGKPILEEKFPSYIGKIAVGLVGKGSDCFGYDDEISRDHDWGPDFCLWLDDKTYEEIGDSLIEVYENLPDQFMGFPRKKDLQQRKRRGVFTISGFYKQFVGADSYEEINWRNVEDYNLACAVNGEVFTDESGEFTSYRNKLLQGYPEEIRLLKIAEDVANLSQTGQYNFFRLMQRGDRLSADRMLAECMGHVMRLQHHICNVYPPHDKWLYKSLESLEQGETVCSLLASLHFCMKLDDEKVVEFAKGVTEEIGDFFANELYVNDIISDINPYLDYHTDELMKKASYVTMTNKELVNRIARLEFEAFDKVKNEGGRASCQNDWPTFSVMRKSQYLTWNRTMLVQYLYDFTREYELGHNLITEKYGRMMESTAPEKYQELAEYFPPISEQKKAVIEQIVSIQMDMVEKFGEEHPKLANNARSFHTYDDNMYNTSYETYLRGEISTYSDKMLQLYGKHVVECATTGRNIAKETIENTAHLYGYSDLEAFEKEA